MNDQLTQPARRSARAWLRLLLTLFIALGLDLGSKALSFQYVADQPVCLDREQLLADRDLNAIPHHDGRVVVPGILNLQLVVNRGAVFGLGAHKRWLFIIFSVIAVTAGLLFFSYKTNRRHGATHIVLGLLLAGGLGNLYDRIAFGVVRDFLYLFPNQPLPFGLHWPGGSNEIFPWIFNGADMMLLAGLGSLVLILGRQEQHCDNKPTHQDKPDDQQSPPPDSLDSPDPAD